MFQLNFEDFSNNFSCIFGFLKSGTIESLISSCAQNKLKGLVPYQVDFDSCKPRMEGKAILHVKNTILPSLPLKPESNGKEPVNDNFS